MCGNQADPRVFHAMAERHQNEMLQTTDLCGIETNGTNGRQSEVDTCNFPIRNDGLTTDISFNVTDVGFSRSSSVFAFCRRNCVMPQLVFQAAWALLLSRYISNSAVSFGFLQSQYSENGTGLARSIISVLIDETEDVLELFHGTRFSAQPWNQQEGSEDCFNTVMVYQQLNRQRKDERQTHEGLRRGRKYRDGLDDIYNNVSYQQGYHCVSTDQLRCTSTL
jgi:hypothetical protein